MKRVFITIILTQLLLLFFNGYAQDDATIPTYQWAYSYLDQLRLRGYLSELNVIQQPYIQRQVFNSLVKLDNQIQQGDIYLSRQDQWLIDFLNREFKINGISETGGKELIIQSGIWVDEQVWYDKHETRFYTQLRSQVGLSLKNNLYFYNGLLLDQSLLADSTYIGEKWRGFAAYTEQAYLRFTTHDLRIKNSDFQFTIGRDFLNWGTGKTGRLLFSDHAQPLDMLSVSLRYKGLQFIALAADLDHWMLADSLVQKYHAAKANRYLSAHRLIVNLKNKLYFGLTEALLYGGPNSNWELKYHNPLLYYHGELLNGGGYDGNGFLYFDFDWYPWQNWEFYGEILIDDFQLEKTVSGDLEPNETGLILGFQHSNWFGFHGSLLGLEYVRVANRTYNSGFEWEKFLHFNRPIGYYLGNNFDRWNLMAQYLPIKGLQVGVKLDYIRNGEGSILDQWDTPWVNYSVSDGYDEPFPFGVVEKSFIASLNLRAHLKFNTILESQISYQTVENALHEIGRNEKQLSLFMKLHWNIRCNLRY